MFSNFRKNKIIFFKDQNNFWSRSFFTRVGRGGETNNILFYAKRLKNKAIILNVFVAIIRGEISPHHAREISLSSLKIVALRSDFSPRSVAKFRDMRHVFHVAIASKLRVSRGPYCILVSDHYL